MWLLLLIPFLLDTHDIVVQKLITKARDDLVSKIVFVVAVVYVLLLLLLLLLPFW